MSQNHPKSTEKRPWRKMEGWGRSPTGQRGVWTVLHSDKGLARRTQQKCIYCTEQPPHEMPLWVHVAGAWSDKGYWVGWVRKSAAAKKLGRLEVEYLVYGEGKGVEGKKTLYFGNDQNSKQSFEFSTLEKREGMNYLVIINVRTIKDPLTPEEIQHIEECEGDISHRQFTGLVNQGQTCYMNSLLQALAHIPRFVREVFELKSDTSSSIIPAFQSLFYGLIANKSKFPLETVALTNAFNWSKNEIFIEHDIQEFCCKVIDIFERKCKSDNIPNFVEDIFGGQIKNYIKCKGVDFESINIEKFYDIQLQVLHCRNIFDSFNIYTKDEALIGENQYQTESNGKQDAIKGSIFKKLPPVLLLHLKRFNFNMETLQNEKILSRYEFPEDLDLSNYKETKESSEYRLYSILVHEGTRSKTGHYFCFCRPDFKKWYRFDDEKITRATDKEVEEASFGGSYFNVVVTDPKKLTLEKRRVVTRSQAYMLIYIKSSESGSIMKQIDLASVTQKIKDRFKSVQKKSYSRISKRKYLRFDVTTPTVLKGLEGPGALTFQTSQNANQLVNFLDQKQLYCTFRVGKTSTFEKLYESLCYEVGVPIKSLYVEIFDEFERRFLPLFSFCDSLSYSKKLVSSVFANVQKQRALILIHPINFKLNMQIMSIDKQFRGEGRLEFDNQPGIIEQPLDYKSTFDCLDLNINRFFLVKKFKEARLEILRYSYISLDCRIEELRDLFQTTDEEALFVELSNLEIANIFEFQLETIRDLLSTKFIGFVISGIQDSQLLSLYIENYRELQYMEIEVDFESERRIKTLEISKSSTIQELFRQFSIQLFSCKVQPNYIKFEIIGEKKVYRLRDNEQGFKNVQMLLESAIDADYVVREDKHLSSEQANTLYFIDFPYIDLTQKTHKITGILVEKSNTWIEISKKLLADIGLQNVIEKEAKLVSDLRIKRK